jgi:hypothetical protein
MKEPGRERAAVSLSGDNRLGFAIQLCLLRYPGRAWLPAEQLPSEMLTLP